MFNRDNIQDAKEQFAKNRYAVIDNILEPRYIKALYKEVPKLPYGVWACVGSTHEKFPAGYKNDSKFHDTLFDYIERGRGTFSYFHYAFWLLKDYHLIHSNPQVTEFNRVVNEDYTISQNLSYTFHDLVSDVTGFENMFTNQPTYSYYDNTSWLAAHHDPKRYCAYIFYFNETWLTQWGGQLCILEQDERTIKDSIEPFGNRLVIMDVTDRVNKHFISPVCITADHPRYSLAGWFYPKEGVKDAS